MIDFPASVASIEERITSINPITYASKRNYRDGAVTRLSPYISRGVISTRQVYEHVRSMNLTWEQAEKLIQELAWRDYWQCVWVEKKDGILEDLKHDQSPVASRKIPKAIVEANTGIDTVDRAIEQLNEDLFAAMHNALPQVNFK